MHIESWIVSRVKEGSLTMGRRLGLAWKIKGGAF